MKIKAEVPVREIDGENVAIGKDQNIDVMSHWNRNGWNGLVVLKIPGLKHEISVDADELIEAVKRCHNLK